MFEPAPMVYTQDGTPTRVCSSCKERFPLDPEWFHRDRSDKHGYARACKECASKRLHNARQRRYLLMATPALFPDAKCQAPEHTPQNDNQGLHIYRDPFGSSSEYATPRLPAPSTLMQLSPSKFRELLPHYLVYCEACRPPQVRRARQIHPSKRADHHIPPPPFEELHGLDTNPDDAYGTDTFVDLPD